MTRFYYLLKRLFVIVALCGAYSLNADAQVITSSPTIIQPSSSGIVITFHADQGNRGLAGLSPSTPVYAHTGVIMKGSDSWSHAPAWGDNSAKYRLTYVSPDTYTLAIGSIAEFYGISDPQNVDKLAFVFRNANSTAEGKTSDNSDIFLDVKPDGLAINFTADVAPGLLSEPATINLTVDCTEPAHLKISKNSQWSTPLASADDATTLTYPANISDYGVTQFIATATKGSTVIADTLIYTYTGPSQPATYPGGVPRMGAVTNDDGTATFCIAAPGKKSVMIVGGWNNYFLDDIQLMNYQDFEGERYFWVTLSGLNTGKQYPYYYIVDNNIKVGDPYATLVLDQSNDKWISPQVYPDMIPYPSEYIENVPLAVYCSKKSNYQWQATDFKRVPQQRLVAYELLIRDFTGTEGKAEASGTIKGVIDKIDYIKNLGVNAVELLPIMEFNGNNSWGYNPNFLFAPDKAYGTPDDYRRLIDLLHANGIAVILDIVLNQTDGQHPWYQMYPTDKNPFYNASAPHAYSVLNDWNQDNPLVQQQFQDALRYWLTEYHVDGFRFDLVKGLGSNSSYNATYNPSTNGFTSVTDAKTNAYNASRVARMKELHDAMRLVDPTAYFINENLAGAQEENEMAADGELNWANVNDASCQFAMGYPADSNLNRFYAPQDGRTAGSTMSYAESHDEQRMAWKVAQYGASGIKGNTAMTCRRLGSVAAMMLMTPGSHLIWQFQEFGADQSTKESSGGNDTSPKKVVWSYLDNADREGLMQTYSTLCKIRNDNPEMFTTSPTANMQCGTANWSAGRFITLKNGDSAIFLVVNPNTTATATVTAAAMNATDNYKLLAASYGVDPLRNGNRITLPAGAFAIYATENIAAIDEATNDDTAVKVYAADGKIIVEGDYSEASVYDITGTLRNFNDTLTHGLYIVIVDNHPAIKIAI